MVSRSCLRVIRNDFLKLKKTTKMAVNLCDSLGTTDDAVVRLVDGTRKMKKMKFEAEDTLQIELDDGVMEKLSDITNNYESIFSWNIKQLTEHNKHVSNLWNFVDLIRERLEKLSNKDAVFSELRFCLQLIISYELYTSGHYQESLKEIESVIQYMESCVYDQSIISYSDAYKHIAHSTYAYIALTLNLEYKMVMNITPENILSREQRAAIFAFKARVFIEYPPKGNDIALKFAEEARDLDCNSSENIAIWLKAKGVVRRYYHRYNTPDLDELNAAELLCSRDNSPSLLTMASKLYQEAGFLFKINKSYKLSNTYYKLSLDLILKAIYLAKDDIGQLSFCLLEYVKYPIKYQSTSVVDNLIKKLTSANNIRVDRALGYYYFKVMKDYEKAKMHLSRAVAAGNFDSSLKLIQVECLLQPVDTFPLVKTLNIMYEVFISPSRRLIILIQILIYYYYYENNPKEIIHYLKLYMDQDIEDTLKRQQLSKVFPLFKVNCHLKQFKPEQFSNALSRKLKVMKRKCFYEWSSRQKKDFDNIIDLFDKMSKGEAQAVERPISLQKGIENCEIVQVGRISFECQNEGNGIKEQIVGVSGSQLGATRHIHKQNDKFSQYKENSSAYREF